MDNLSSSTPMRYLSVSFDILKDIKSKISKWISHKCVTMCYCYRTSMLNSLFGGPAHLVKNSAFFRTCAGPQRRVGREVGDVCHGHGHGFNGQQPELQGRPDLRKPTSPAFPVHEPQNISELRIVSVLFSETTQ